MADLSPEIQIWLQYKHPYVEYNRRCEIHFDQGYWWAALLEYDRRYSRDPRITGIAGGNGRSIDTAVKRMNSSFAKYLKALTRMRRSAGFRD